MKFSALFFLAVAFSIGGSNSALGNDDGVKIPIDKYQLLGVGIGVPWEPTGIVLKLAPLEFLIFFEIHPDRLAGGAPLLKSEVFSGGEGVGGCDNGGNLLVTTNNYTISSETVAYPQYNHMVAGNKWPQTTNGVIVATNFSVSDILGPTGDKAIYRPMGDGAPDNIGHAVLCVRNSLQLDYGNGNTEYITYVDARLQLSVNTQSTASFGGNGELPPPQMGISVVMDPTSGPGGKTMIETTSKTVVVVESFLCGRSAINDGKPFQETYKIGQEFQICVRPAGVDPSAINIVDFKSIVCENSNHKRTILSNGVIDPLSDIIKNATWSKGLVEGQVTGDHGIAFRSVITSAFFAGSNTSSIQCKGEVSLGFASNANRQLVAAKFHGVQHRDLQNTREEAAPFATSVVLSRDRVFEIPTSNAVTITAHRKRTIISGMGIVIAMILAF